MVSSRGGPLVAACSQYSLQYAWPRGAVQRHALCAHLASVLSLSATFFS
jgi:hypothetical protein